MPSYVAVTLLQHVQYVSLGVLGQNDIVDYVVQRSLLCSSAALSSWGETQYVMWFPDLAFQMDSAVRSAESPRYASSAYGTCITAVISNVAWFLTFWTSVASSRDCTRLK